MNDHQEPPKGALPGYGLVELGIGFVLIVVGIILLLRYL